MIQYGGWRHRAAPRRIVKLTDHDQFMTTEEVLEYLQVNLRTIYRLIRRRNIPAIRVERQWRFRRGDIEAWLETHRATAAQPVPPSARPEGVHACCSSTTSRAASTC